MMTFLNAHYPVKWFLGIVVATLTSTSNIRTSSLLQCVVGCMALTFSNFIQTQADQSLMFPSPLEYDLPVDVFEYAPL